MRGRYDSLMNPLSKGENIYIKNVMSIKSFLDMREKFCKGEKKWLKGFSLSKGEL